MIDDLIALRLQLEWGADDVLGDMPVDRFSAPTSPIAVREPELREMRVAAPPAPPSSSPVVLRSGGAAPAVEARTLDELHAALDAFT
ncbi:MAG: uracil-DNA glycosylase, partial [Pseudomonadota bacterium]|nr:uracil-DNA glycosylase [Pseudomonadota bacterium]